MTLAENFFELYAGLTRAHGLYHLGKVDPARGKTGGRAETVMEDVTLAKWESHLAGALGLGIVPIRDDATVRFGAIDVDEYPLDLNNLFDRVVQLDLPLIVIRTKSGGAHLTCFTSEPVQAKIMRAKLMEMAIALGYPGVEIFPKQSKLASENDCGNWLNMPYFDVSNTMRYAIYRGKSLTAEEFLKYANKIAISAEALDNLIINLGPDFADGPPCLQAMARSGIDRGMRNEAMFAFGVYTRNKHGHDWEEKFVELNEQICSPPLPSRELATITKSLGRKEYFYPCKRAPCVNLCNREVCQTREFGIGQQSDELNVTLGTLVKIDYEKPLWIISVNGVRFEIETDTLLSQANFHRACVEKVNLWPNKIKPTTWQTLVQQRLSEVEIITPPSDSSDEGRFLSYLEQYLTTTALSKTQDELLQGKPWTDPDDGMTYFRSNDLMDYLERQHFRAVNQRGAWSILRNHEAVHKQLQIKGRCVMVWGVKEYKRSTEKYDSPQFPEREF